MLPLNGRDRIGGVATRFPTWGASRETDAHDIDGLLPLLWMRELQAVRPAPEPANEAAAADEPKATGRPAGGATEDGDRVASRRL